MSPPWRLAVDTGGTFTDVVLWRPGHALACHKLLSTPQDPSRAVLEGIRAILSQVDAPQATPFVIHGSTVATNALLEGKGAQAALVTTAGFEDLLHLGRQDRADLYALHPHRPAPPLQRKHCFGVPERVTSDGQIKTPLTRPAIDALIQALSAHKVSAIAVSLLHSYTNPSHEAMLGQALRQAFPDTHLTLSSQLLPEIREFERTSTCLANAVVAPHMDAYLARLGDHLGPDRLRIMASAGGSMKVQEVRRAPVHTVLSGPAGGVVGALEVVRALKLTPTPRLISFDMGGTSTDVALCDGRLQTTTSGQVGPLPIRVPLLDIHTVGAGGGSIAWVDAGGALRVGPASCSSDPGPACYGRQTKAQAAVTDAHVVLGRLPVDRFLGGSMHLDAQAAAQAVGRIAQGLGMTLEACALGILRVAEATMARAIKVISVQRSHDVRDYALVCFGGAGGLHACNLAQSLGMSTVILPRRPGLLSAVGMLYAPSVHTASRTLLRRAAPSTAPLPLTALPDAAQQLGAMHDRLARRLTEEGFAPHAQHITQSLDLRYEGQSHELTVRLDKTTRQDLRAALSAAHHKMYGYQIQDRALELVTLRVRAEGHDTQPSPEILPTGAPGRPLGTPHQAWYGDALSTGTLVAREDLLAHDELAGPHLITEYSSTTVVPPGWHTRVHPQGHLILTRQPDA